MKETHYRVNEGQGSYSHSAQYDEDEQEMLQTGPMILSPWSFRLRLRCIHMQSTLSSLGNAYAL